MAAEAFVETTVNGRHTRRWNLDASVCRELAAHRIARLGLESVQAPYSRVRLRPAGSFFLASLEGEGRIWLEGKWQRLGAGSLCLAPPRVLNAFQPWPGKRWVFAWVRYDEPGFVQPLVRADSPLRLRTGAEAFGRVVEGLRAEWEAERDPALVHHWVSLLHGQMARLARPWQTGSRLHKLWEAIAAEPAADWKLTTLAERCHMSAEHLRRLCLRELGRTPMDQVTSMRMQEAKALLESTDEKIEAIAQRVGYRSATVFSRAFARCIGLTPSVYRERK